MAGGWTRDDSVNDQIRDSVADEVERVRRKLPKGKSPEFCDDCGEPITEARRKALPGVRTCVACQESRDGTDRHSALFNRRGSKDSQLK